MEKEKVITKHLNIDAATVWEVVKKPAYLAVHGDVKTTIVSDLEWIEHTGEAVDNRCVAKVDEATKTVSIQSESSKYKTEHDAFKISVKEVDGGCDVTIDFDMFTGAIANILVMKVAGDKIVEGSIDKLFHHIEKKCK